MRRFMRRGRFWGALCLLACLASGGSGFAQGPERVELPPLVGEVGRTFEVPVHAFTSVPTDIIYFEISPIHGVLDPIYVAPGAALEEYEDVHGGAPDCDIIIFPDALVVLMPFDHPYSSAQFGTEWIRIQFSVTASTPGWSEVAVTFGTGHGFVTTLVPLQILPPPPVFQRGDSNNDGIVGIGDGIHLLAVLFSNLPMPSCPDAADANDDGRLDLGDAIAILNHLFGNTVPTLRSECAADSSPDALSFCSSIGC